MLFRCSVLLLTCFVSTCMAESPFSGPLVGVIIVVGILLSAIFATAVALLIVWIRWQKTGEGPSNERLDLEASPRQRRLRESSVMGKAKKEEAKEEEIVEDEGERYGEQIQQNVREPIPPVYSTPVTLRPPSPTDSFTSTEENEYHNVGGVIGAKETNHYDDTLTTEAARRAPPPPANKPQGEKKVDEEDKPDYENTAKRRAPPPRPVIVGEEQNTSTTFGTSHQMSKEPEKELQLTSQVVVTPANVKQRPAPPAKPKTTDPPATTTKPKLHAPPPPPPSKPKSSSPQPHLSKSSSPPAPSTKPKINMPPAPPSKPKLGEPPAPPTKPKHGEPPAPPSKPKLSEPPKPPTKPQATKPKPQIQPKPTENPTPSGLAPKPKAKPRVPVKPSEVNSSAGSECHSGVNVPVTHFGEHVASQHADGNTGFSREFDVSRGIQSGKGTGWGREE